VFDPVEVSLVASLNRPGSQRHRGEHSHREGGSLSDRCTKLAKLDRTPRRTVMKLTPLQLQEFDERGYLFLPFTAFATD
jgi:hypothetical protein